MAKVYVSGALTDVQDAEKTKSFYADIGKLCRSLGLEAYVPHENDTDPDKHPNVTPRNVFETDFHHVSTSDLIIAYSGAPSLGVGIELGWAHLLSIPIVLVYESDKRVSRLPRGLPNVSSEVIFQSHDKALEDLKNILKELFP